MSVSDAEANPEIGVAPGQGGSNSTVDAGTQEEIEMIRLNRQAAVGLLCLIASTFAMAANELPDATVEFSSGSMALVGGVRWGAGTLHYQGKSYPFVFSGVAVGDVGAKGTWGTGEVYHLRRVEDFAGNYNALSLGLTLAGGGAAATMQNQNGVAVDVRGASLGLGINFSIEGVSVKLGAAP